MVRFPLPSLVMVHFSLGSRVSRIDNCLPQLVQVIPFSLSIWCGCLKCAHGLGLLIGVRLVRMRLLGSGFCSGSRGRVQRLRGCLVVVSES